MAFDTLARGLAAKALALSGGSALAAATNSAASAVLSNTYAAASAASATVALTASASAAALSYAGGSARFPYRNRHAGDLSPFAMLAQPTANQGTWFAADGALLATVCLPRERLRASGTGQSNVSRVLLGNTINDTSANNFYVAIDGAPGVFQTRLIFYMRSSGATSIPLTAFLIPEAYGARLLFAFRRTSNTFSIDVWNCDTGTKYTGPTADITTFVGTVMTAGGSYMQVGSGGNTATAPAVPAFTPLNYRCWDGDVGLVGYYAAALSDAACAAIALGGAVEANSTPATWKWVRQLDGSTASLTTPVWATGDTTSPATVVTSGGLSVDRGSSLTAKGTYFTIDRRVAGDAHVSAVIPGQAVKMVTVSGLVRSTLPSTDTVEMRFITVDGSYATPWSKVATINPGDTTWSGTAPVPKSQHQYVRQGRLTSQNGDPTKWLIDATRFGVGYRALVIGQSQPASLAIATRAVTYTGKTKFSFIEQATGTATDYSAINTLNVHDRLPPIGDGIAGIMNAIDAAGCDAVVALELQCVGGTSAIDWINDSLSGRTWTPMLRSNEVMDGGRSTIVWNWDAHDIANNYASVLDAVFCGTGALAGDHYVFGPLTDGGTQIGATVTYMPVLRINGTATSETDYDTYGATWGTRRDEGVAWAASKPFCVIGSPPVDMEIQDWAHPSTTLATGTERHGQHLGFSIVRGLRLDASTNPTVNAASFAFTDGTRTAFTFRINLPNFGAIRNGLSATSDTGADKAMRLIEVSSNAGTTWTKSGFTAALTGRDLVTVTKTTGSWAAGLLAHVGYGGFGAYGDPSSGGAVTAGNIAARDYWLYDGYSRHINGKGVPLLPSNTVYSVAG